VLKGSCSIRIGGQIAEVVQGDLFSVPPLNEHSVSLIPGMDVQIAQIDFLPDFIHDSMADLASMEGFLDFAYWQPIAAVSNQCLPKLNLATSSQLAVEQLLRNMTRELTDRDEGYLLSIRIELLRLLIIAGREYRGFLEGKKEKQIVLSHRRLFFETVAYIQHHYAEELRLDRMAEMAAMGSSYFSHLFKVIVGKTFVEYVNELRIKKAMELLRETERTVTEVHLQAGFQNLGYFNRAFKKYTGVTPSYYRKRHQ
jgi:AraC-like DNA-binding protein